MLAGAGAGALGGALAGPVGAAVGALAGGIAGGFGVKLIADQFIEDDRVEMFAQLKEEFIDIVMVISLSKEEFNKIQEAVFNEQLEALLKDMFQRKEESRNYAKEFVEGKIKSIIKDRDQVELKEIIDAIQVLNGSGNSSDSGWNQYDGAWYYLNNSSSLATGWIQDNGEWYYLNDNGSMETGWYQVGNKWYYSDSSGALAVNTTIDGYRVNEKGECID